MLTGGTSVTSVRYPQWDEEGNVTGVWTPGNVWEYEDYSPFGQQMVVGTSLADTNRLRWRGLMWEGDSTQLYYMRNRWYDPTIGRFMSQDPIGLAGGINPYAFGGGDYLQGRDPSGDCANPDGFNVDSGFVFTDALGDSFQCTGADSAAPWIPIETLPTIPITAAPDANPFGLPPSNIVDNTPYAPQDVSNFDIAFARLFSDTQVHGCPNILCVPAKNAQSAVQASIPFQVFSFSIVTDACAINTMAHWQLRDWIIGGATGVGTAVAGGLAGMAAGETLGPVGAGVGFVAGIPMAPVMGCAATRLGL
jgi:RHS repeat-associated protein